MGSNVSMPATPAPVAPIDPGQSSLDYINAMSDPALQGKLLASEQEFRPQYTALNLQDINQYLQGTGGQPGALEQLGTATRASNAIQAQANTASRAADIADVGNLGASATAAFKGANPELYAQLANAGRMSSSNNNFGAYNQAVMDSQAFGPISARQGSAAQVGPMQGYTAQNAAPVSDVYAQQMRSGPLGNSLYGQAMQSVPTGAANILQDRAQQLAQSTGQMSPDEIRQLTQASREGFAARGTEMSNPSLVAEMTARQEGSRERQMQDLQMAAALNQAYTQDKTSAQNFATGVYGQNLGLQQANQGANLQAAQGNQQMAGGLSLANQGAQNTASQYFASAQNQGTLANAELQQQMNLANLQAALGVDQYNSQFAYQQQQQKLANLGTMGQYTGNQLGQDRSYALGLTQAIGSTTFDPMAAILGKQSGAVGVGQQQQNYATGLTSSMQGPQLFDPNAGINLGLQQNANQANYQANIYGAQASYAGATNQGRGAMIGGALSGLGAAGGAAIIVA